MSEKTLPEPSSSERAGVVDRLSGWVAAHSRIATGAIAALSVAVVGLLLYYRGIGKFGPYAKTKRAFKPKKASTGAGGGAAPAAPAADEEPDPPEDDGAQADGNTEELIASLESPPAPARGK